MKTFKSNLLFVFLVFKIFFAAPCAAQNKTLSISIAANDIVYDSSRQVIYATIRSEDSYNFGNKVVAIDPVTGKITKSVFVGNQPMRMALTSNQEYLYVSLGGSPRIIRLRLDLFTVDQDFLTTHHTQLEFDYPQDDIAVLPNRNDYVISTLSSNQGELDLGFGVSTLKKGRQLAVAQSGAGGWADFLVDSRRNIIGSFGVSVSNLAAVDSNIVVGTDGYSAIIMRRTAGDTIVPQFYYRGQSALNVSGALYARIAIDSHIIYTSAGKVVRLTPTYELQPITTLPDVNNPHRPFSFSVDKQGVYYANTEGNNVKIKKFNKTTYALDAEYLKIGVLPNATVTPRRLITLKDRKAALIVQNDNRLDIAQYRIIIFNLDGNADPLVNLERESLSTTERTAMVTSLAIAAEDMVFDSLRQRYYVSVKDNDPTHAKSILSLNAQTFAVEQKITLPETAVAPLILSKDARYLYFQQIVNHKLLRLDLTSWTAAGTYDMGVNPNVNRNYFLADGASIATPSTPIALVIGDDYYSNGAPQVHLFDTAFNFVRRYPLDGLLIESSMNGKTLFNIDVNTTARFIQRFFVNNQTLITNRMYQKVAAGFASQHKLFNDKIYASNRLVTRVTDTVCFVDAYYPSLNNTIRRSVLPTDKGIFLTELETQGQPNVIIRNMDAKTLTLRELIRLNNLPNLNFSGNEVSQSAYDAVNKTLGFIVKQPYSNSPTFQNRGALFFVRDFFTGIQTVDFAPHTISFSTYPNPFSNTVTMEWTGMERFEKATILIQDATGRVLDVLNLAKTTLNQASFVYQNDQLGAGFYFLTLVSDARILKTVKMVKF